MNIYNFAMLDDKDKDNIVMITEISKDHNNDILIQMANKLFLYLIENNIISNDVLVIITYVKHFSKTIKNITFTKNGNINKNIQSLNSIILDFIKKNDKKDKLNNFLVYYKDNTEISINRINSKFPLSKFNKYYQ
jgi:hypothetical protein